MADTLIPSLRQIRLVMNNITEAVSQMLENPDIASDTLQTRLRMQGLISDIISAVKFRIKVSAYRRLQTEHGKFIISFTRLVTVVTAQLYRLDAAAESNERLSHFWVLWEFLTESWNAWIKWMEIQNISGWGLLPANPPALSIAISGLMAWLLSASRTNSYAWVKPQVESADFVSQLYLILFVPVNNLCNIHICSPTPAADMQEPPSFLKTHLSLLCCLVSEQLGEKLANPPAPPTTQAAVAHTIYRTITVCHRFLFSQLATAISRAAAMMGPTPSQALLDTFSTPAVIALLQLEIVLQGQENQTLAQSGNVSLLVALVLVMEYRIKLAQSGPGGSGNSSSSSGGLDMLPLSTVSQHRLLRELCGQDVPLDHLSSLVRVKLLHALRDCWE